MARPLPKDVEKQIAGTAKRAEIRSVAVFSFIAGGICGFGVAVALFGSEGAGNWAFGAGVVIIGGVWLLAMRKRKG